MDKVKIIGVIATVIGAAATLTSNWVSDKKTETEITEKVNEAVKALKGSN